MLLITSVVILLDDTAQIHLTINVKMSISFFGFCHYLPLKCLTISLTCRTALM